MYAALNASVFKKVVGELLELEYLTDERIKALTKKEKGEVEPDQFRIGGTNG